MRKLRRDKKIQPRQGSRVSVSRSLGQFDRHVANKTFPPFLIENLQQKLTRFQSGTAARRPADSVQMVQRGFGLMLYNNTQIPTTVRVYVWLAGWLASNLAVFYTLVYLCKSGPDLEKEKN